MTRRDIDHNNPVGPLMFTCFKDFCMIERNAMEGGLADEPEPVKLKTKTAHGARFTSDESSSDESITAIHAAGSGVGPGSSSTKPWYPSGLRFPCPLDNHKHETTACTQFFGLCPKERWNRIERRRVCYTCMKPRDVCKGPKCSNYKKVPEILLCSGCADVADKRGWAPLNILYCRKADHKELRAPIAEIKRAWEKYLGKFECRTPEPNIKITVGITYQAHNVVQKRKPGTVCNAPCIDSSSGAKVAPSSGKIIPEKDEDSFYMMQTLQIGSSRILAFLDSGSNAHLIDEKIAASEGLLKTSEKPVAISVVGGGNIKSCRSTYQFNLGPGTSGEFYEMNCISMESVTTKFREYDLQEINEEYRIAYGDKLVLPERIGGSKVHLLIGIKNVHLTPILERVLDSGVAVYVSPFTDIYGSNRIYAGPHSTFTKGNQGFKTHAVYTFRKEIDDLGQITREEEEEIIEQRSYSVVIDNHLGLTCHPHPLLEEDVIAAGVPTAEEFEDRIDSKASEMIHRTNNGAHGHHCSVYKATVPIARMREIVDQDDCDEVSTY